MGSSRLDDVDNIGGSWRLRPDCLGRLVLAQPLERGLADHACARESGKLDFRYQFRLQPMHPGLLAGRTPAAEWIDLGCRSPELRHQARNLISLIARSDVADVDQVVAPIYARHQ